MSAPGNGSQNNDLFISYSHIDNRPWGAGQREWVTEFHRELETRLAQLVGRDVIVWRDTKIAGHDEFDDRIVNELQRSRLFLCVMTPRYLKSEWCQKEIGLFLGEPTGSAEARRPLFKVIKTPIDVRDEPAPARRLLGYEFFREVGPGKVHEFYPSRDENSVDSREFWQKVDDLAQEMKAVLDERRNNAPPARTKTVFLAETTGDVRIARDAIRRELGQRGYHVVPDRALPLFADELSATILADLASASLTVHPVGNRYGVVPEGETRSLVELQLDMALKKNGHAQHLIWIAPPDGADQVEERHQQFLEKLRRVYTEQHGTELLERVALEEVKTRLVDKLEPKQVSSVPSATGTAGPGSRIYLVCDAGEREAVKPIEGYLRANGCRVNWPLWDGSVSEIREDHQETLKLCDAVLIYYGTGRPAWLREKQRDLLKAPGWGRTRPFLAQAVCIGPPASEEKSSYLDDDFIVVRADTGLVPESLQIFLDRVRKAAGTGA